MSEVMKGKVPVYDPDRGFRVWNYDETYTGPDGAGVMVPNIGDAVLIWNVGWHKVIDLNLTSYLYEYVYQTFTEQNDFDQIDILFGVGAGYTSETFRAYLDTSVKPYRLAVDTRLHSYGSMSSHYKLFLGTDISSSAGRVISALYDQSNTYVGENVPFELAARSDVQNHNIKAPAEGSCHLELKDGQLVTLVAYSDTGVVVGINKLLIQNTAFIRKSEANQLTITKISLASPWLADDVDKTLRIPMNLPLESLNLRGRVHYSNGHVRDVPIDGTKMDLYGLDNYISTINGQTAPLVLSYKLSPNEISNVAGGTPNQYHISEPYRAVSTEVAGTYSVKLFVVPEWIDESTGWRLEYYLYNLDRGDVYYVTPHVEMGVNSAVYDPLLMGVKQTIVVAVDMQRIDPRLAQYRHAQTLSITLLNNGIDDVAPYIIEYDPGQDPDFGGELSCRVTFNAIGDWSVDISQGLFSLEEWLDVLYTRVKPLYDKSAEAGPLTPTHFILSINGYRTKYPIASWNTALNSTTGGKPGRSAVIEWIRETAGSTLNLAASPLKIFHEVPGNGGGETPVVNFYNSWATAIGQTESYWMGSSASTLKMSSSGVGVADWTTEWDDDGNVEVPPIEFTFADGAGLANTTMEIKVSVVSRYENGNNYMWVDGPLDTWVTIDGEFLIPVKMKGWIGSNKTITIEIHVRDKNNPENGAVGNYILGTGVVPE